ADLGAVIAARHEAEVGAGQRRNVAQAGAANRGADFSVAGVVDTHEGRTFRCSRTVKRGVAGEGGHGQHAHASDESKGLGETARSSRSESHGVPLSFSFAPGRAS